MIARVCRKGNKVSIIEPINFEVDRGVSSEAVLKAFSESQKVWTRRIGRYDVHLHIANGKGDPDALQVRLRHYQVGDQPNMKNWHIPNPSDGTQWTNYDWSVLGHEIGHDLLGFADNGNFRTKTIMSRRSDGPPDFVPSELDIELILENFRTIKESEWEACRCGL
ncbi:hypothetical protein [Lysobacter sp. Root559]|uniref:hypothetical protein n=1 Tax=Lysobacter sp. Root559 TaxID=1736559 RepID=UPI001F15BA11|nr:hypothetical protein [Lysobacter sp. Root559]